MVDRGRLVMTSAALALGAFIWLSGCGGGDERERRPDADDAASVATSDDQSSGDDRDAAPEVDRCPLTVEQVSNVLAREMTIDEASCSFFPPEGGPVLPNASFNVQFPMVCSNEGRSGTGYEQSVSGLGDAAYVRKQADGTWLLVCAGESAFEIRVDSGRGDDASQAAAEELARRVLERR